MDISIGIVRLVRKLVNKISVTVPRVKRRFCAPDPPKNSDGTTLIHLGCGPINDPRWINVDLLYLPHIHHIQDITKLDNFPDNSADLIYACHAFEHISHRELVDVMSEWRRVLKPRGILRISVPDFDCMVHIYNSEGKDMKAIIKPLMGGQDYRFNFHYSAFNKNYLLDLFRAAGFSEVRDWDPKYTTYHSFDDWSDRLYPINGREYPISLNLEGIK